MYRRMTGLEELWVDIVSNPKVMSTDFNPYFLTQAAEILDKRGFHEVRIFLWDSGRDRRLRGQTEAILYVINAMESTDDVRRDRSKGRFLLRQISMIG